jgi:molybdopterin converting factor small subunit
MKILVKLFATLRQGRFTTEDRDYPPGTTVRTIVTELGIPEQQLGIILVNSRHVNLERSLAEGDVLAIFPLVGGG